MKTLHAVVIVVALSGTGLRAQDSTRALDWTLIYARPATGKYEDISFPDPTHGWVVTARGDILHTADGGATWTSQASGLLGLRSIDLVDRMHGFAGTLTGKLYATTDGGTVWTEITSSLPKQQRGFAASRTSEIAFTSSGDTPEARPTTSTRPTGERRGRRATLRTSRAVSSM